jgi:hypothetical protein
LQETQYRVSAYDSVVTIVEPEISFLDWQLYVLTLRRLGQPGQRLNAFPSRWSTYLIILGILGGGAYFAFLSFFPKSKKPKTAAVVGISAPVPVAATNSGGYEEEWIPEHHLKKTKKSGAVTSDAETSGGEVSGKEGPRRRKGKK